MLVCLSLFIEVYMTWCWYRRWQPRWTTWLFSMVNEANIVKPSLYANVHCPLEKRYL